VLRCVRNSQAPLPAGMPPKPADECERAKASFDAGNAARQANDLPAALEAYTAGIETARSVELRSALHVNRGVTLAALGQYQEALADSESCAKIRPSWSRTYECYATALHGLGRSQEADVAMKLAEALKTLKQDPKNEESKMRVKALRREIRSIQSDQTPAAEQKAPSDVVSTPQAAASQATHEADPAHASIQTQSMPTQEAEAHEAQHAPSDPAATPQLAPQVSPETGPSAQGSTQTNGAVPNQKQRFKAAPPPPLAVSSPKAASSASPTADQQLEQREDSVSFLIRGNELQSEQDHEGALASYAKALEMTREPELRKAIFFNCSIANAHLQRFDKAEQDADECIRIDPLWPDGFECKGTALEVALHDSQRH
jgi:tetratricopeptide (TPR) repeat protein